MRGTSRRSIKIYRWRRRGAPAGNFGDEITIDLLAKLFGIEAEVVSMAEAELIGAGSILDLYSSQPWRRRIRNYRSWIRWSRDLHVWGAGVLRQSSSISWPQRMHFHAVRGEFTAARAQLKNVQLGDPGILVSRLVERPKRRSAVAFIPHWTEWNYASKLDLPKSWVLVRPEQVALDAVRQIAASELIVSSSLHGLITADAFNIPSIWAEPEGPIHWDQTFKFGDYASSRGRPFNKPAKYGHLLAMKGSELADLSTTSAKDMDEWQDELIKSFPFAN